MGDTQEGDDSHAMRTTERDEIRQLEQQLKDLSCTPYFDGLFIARHPQISSKACTASVSLTTVLKQSTG